MDTFLLRKELENQRYSLSLVSEKTGISYQTLWRKLSGKTEFTASEIACLVDLLSIPKSKIYDFFLRSKVTNDTQRDSCHPQDD